MNWIFINKQVLQPKEYEQVISHEKVHVQHKHSVDLLLAHIITIFQWFNPLTWRIQKSIKTCHEYIADRQVIDQGHELFDYQSLLLSQLISIRSVELVNNFNLLSIKKRIAMMNKIKSGNSAKLKALLVFPMLTIAFFFFANMTSKTNLSQTVSDTENIEGSWMAVHKKVNEKQYVSFKNDKAVFITIEDEDVILIDEFSCTLESNEISLKGDETESSMEYRIRNGNLILFMDDEEKIFERFDGTYIVMDGEMRKLNVPTAKSVKSFDYDYVLFSILLSKDGFFVDGEGSDLENLESSIRKELASLSPTVKTIMLEIDEGMKMKDVDKIKHALRENDLLKIGYVAKAHKSTGITETNTALLNLLPPKTAKMIDLDNLESKGISLFKVNHSLSSSYETKARDLHEHLKGNKKYVILYEYSNKTTYNDYIQTLDMVYSTVWSLRKELASNNGWDYNKLTKEQDKALKKKYPLTLTMKNVDVK
ncbi:M56 family metallopeptidase [Carboxylicivirga marina]|uniref:Peptidase M56 domain-containing protein n=1 Tax=Carboxylicivirga marina TaxID=2800988 RepID=A0ABS1HP02_9BACT|nr:M56 family metallopeptidase [Carboxylicivirga marina]MBK3519311.1 hypothetical protein [Carboxylicivirga marina]